MQIINKFIKKLSQITINVAKDWGGYRITNIGAPTTAGDALRKGTRFGKDQFEWTTDKLLKGAGAGADPTEIDVPTAGAPSASGSYTGNSTVNRAIPHGLGVTPKIVFIRGAAVDNFSWIFGAEGNMIYQYAATRGTYSVTIPNSTNFYVGNATNYDLSKNLTDNVYYWVAIG